jgi:hypothetical protein
MLNLFSYSPSIIMQAKAALPAGPATAAGEANSAKAATATGENEMKPISCVATLMNRLH